MDKQFSNLITAPPTPAYRCPTGTIFDNSIPRRSRYLGGGGAVNLLHFELATLNALSNAIATTGEKLSGVLPRDDNDVNELSDALVVLD